MCIRDSCVFVHTVHQNKIIVIYNSQRPDIFTIRAFLSTVFADCSAFGTIKHEYDHLSTDRHSWESSTGPNSVSCICCIFCFWQCGSNFRGLSRPVFPYAQFSVFPDYHTAKSLFCKLKFSISPKKRHAKSACLFFEQIRAHLLGRTVLFQR